MRRFLTIMVILLLTITVSAQEHLQKQASDKVVKKSFTTLKENPITSVKNQYCTSFLTPCVVGIVLISSQNAVYLNNFLYLCTQKRAKGYG